MFQHLEGDNRIRAGVGQGQPTIRSDLYCRSWSEIGANVTGSSLLEQGTVWHRTASEIDDIAPTDLSLCDHVAEGMCQTT